MSFQSIVFRLKSTHRLMPWYFSCFHVLTIWLSAACRGKLSAARTIDGIGRTVHRHDLDQAAHTSRPCRGLGAWRSRPPDRFRITRYGSSPIMSWPGMQTCICAGQIKHILGLDGSIFIRLHVHSINFPATMSRLHHHHPFTESMHAYPNLYSIYCIYALYY